MVKPLEKTLASLSRLVFQGPVAGEEIHNSMRLKLLVRRALNRFTDAQGTATNQQTQDAQTIATTKTQQAREVSNHSQRRRDEGRARERTIAAKDEEVSRSKEAKAAAANSNQQTQNVRSHCHGRRGRGRRALALTLYRKSKRLAKPKRLRLLPPTTNERRRKLDSDRDEATGDAQKDKKEAGEEEKKLGVAEEDKVDREEPVRVAVG